MKEIKANTVKGQSIIAECKQRARHSESVYTAYGRYSTKKADIWERYKKLLVNDYCCEYVAVSGHNSSYFSIVAESETAYYKITYANGYVVYK